MKQPSVLISGYELRETLSELVARGEIFATRDPDGELRFHAFEHGGAEDALQKSVVLRELKT